MKKILLYALLAFAALVVISIGVVMGRQALANAQIERDREARPAALPKLLATGRLEVIPLYEVEGARADLQLGHGVSYLVRTDSTTVLLDLGDNPDETAQLPSLQNMQALGISPDEIDAIAFSHPHWDHFGGQTAWRTKTIPFDQLGGHLGEVPIFAPVPMTIQGADVRYSAQPTLIASDVGTTGVLSYPEIFPLSVIDPAGYEQGLLVNVDGQGPILITGCGHPTLERLVSRAELILGQPIAGVVGGLHYGDMTTAELQPHIDFLQARQPVLVALSPHDTGTATLDLVRAAFPNVYARVRVGEAIRLPRSIAVQSATSLPSCRFDALPNPASTGASASHPAECADQPCICRPPAWTWWLP